MTRSVLTDADARLVLRCIDYRRQELSDVLSRVMRGRHVNRAEFQALDVASVEDIDRELLELDRVRRVVLS